MAGVKDLPFVELVHPEDQRSFERHMDLVQKDGPGETLTFQMLRKDGDYLWVEASASKTVWEDNAAILYLLRDVTERKQAEDALRASEEKFRMLAETIGDVFWITTPGFEEMLYVSPAYEKIWGLSRDSLYQDPISFIEAIHDEDRERVKAGILGHAQGSWNFEYRIVQSDGTIRWIEDRHFPIQDEDGTLLRMAGVATDITERKEMERALTQREKLNTLGTIAAEVVHEIRNPLVSIAGFARRINRKFPDSPESEIILRESERLENILSRIRGYLRPDELHPQECSVNDMINDCARLLAPEMERRKVEWRSDLDQKLPDLFVDRDILTQVFINLILNAIKAMEEGETLHVRTTQSKRNVAIEFRNAFHGPKIGDPDLLFKHFAEGGQSIGLPFCNRMIANMDGLLTIEQEKDHMVVRVSLPKTDQSALCKANSR
jgi:PAS domain S-box-containing protein